MLRRVAVWGQKNNVRVAYLLPWALYRKGEEEKALQANVRLLAEINTLLPVLRDDRFGVWDKPEDFSDTELHLTHDGAVYRTTSLVPAFRDWDVYRQGELSADLQGFAQRASP